MASFWLSGLKNVCMFRNYFTIFINYDINTEKFTNCTCLSQWKFSVTTPREPALRLKKRILPTPRQFLHLPVQILHHPPKVTTLILSHRVTLLFFKSYITNHSTSARFFSLNITFLRFMYVFHVVVMHASLLCFLIWNAIIYLFF